MIDRGHIKSLCAINATQRAGFYLGPLIKQEWLIKTHSAAGDGGQQDLTQGHGVGVCINCGDKYTIYYAKSHGQ